MGANDNEVKKDKDVVSVCAWCDTPTTETHLTKEEIRELEKLGKVSHGICQDCYDEQGFKSSD